MSISSREVELTIEEFREQTRQMSAEQATSDKFASLRRRAESVVTKQPADLEDSSLEELQRLVYELSVYQIELEMQNEELRATQLAREQAQKNYVALYDSAPVGYITLDQDGMVVEANLTSAALLGIGRRSLVGARLAGFVALEDQDAYYLYCWRLFNVKTLQRRDLKLVKKDGVSFYARLEGRFVEADGPESSQSDPPPPLPQARIVISDINREQQAEARLRQSEARLEAIISTALDAIITVDAWQRIILFNAAAARVFGYQAEQVIGRPLDLLLPERFQDRHAEYLEQFGRAGVSARRMGSITSNLRGRRANGEEFPIEAMISQVEVSGQKFYTVILRDITQRQQAEAAKEHFFQQVSRQREQLLALTRQLAETQEVERKELARELHDRVGQKLTALSLNLNLIRTQLAQTAAEASPPQARLDDSLTLVAEMTEHIRDVLTNLRPPMLDDYGLVATLRWYGSQLASRVNFTITVQGEEPRPRLVAPVENALFRITQEALTNVAKHAQASQVIITIRADDKSVRLLIVDDGVGFEPAYQAETVERHGWGVFTMQERAEAVGGQCSIKSRPGQGTQVIVEVTPPANS